MIKRDITETVCEYDKEGKLVRKVVTETHEEENNTITNYPWTYVNRTQPYCGDTVPCTLTTTMKYNSDCCADKVTSITG